MGCNVPLGDFLSYRGNFLWRAIGHQFVVQGHHSSGMDIILPNTSCGDSVMPT